jgi:hypothetical protein
MNTVLHEPLTREEATQFFAVSGYNDRIDNKIVVYYDDKEKWQHALHIMTEHVIFDLMKKIVASVTDEGQFVISAYLNA